MKTLPSVVLCAFMIIIAQQNYAQKIYQWRGENRDGIYNETSLLEVWPEKGPELLWFTEEIGQGYAAPVITTDKVLINGEANGLSYLFAFDLKGKLLWKTPNGKEFSGSDYSANFPGARSVPTVVGDLVYTISGKGRMACMELQTGKEKWAIYLVEDLLGIENEFGYAESPLVDGDIIYCMPGGKNNNVVALNRFTRKIIWTSKALSQETSFCSPMLIKLPSLKIFVSLSRHSIFALNALNGELLWSQKLENFKYEGEHCNTPVFSDGFLYYTAADENGNGTVKLEISPDGKSMKEIWRNKDNGNAYGGFVKLNDELFLCTNDKKMVCIDAKNGNMTNTLKSVKGGLIFAQNRFYCYNESGEMKLISYQNNLLTEISKFKITKGSKEHFSHPVIANGILYLRHGKALMAYDILKK